VIREVGSKYISKFQGRPSRETEEAWNNLLSGKLETEPTNVNSSLTLAQWEL
jgi:hypothetical protein